MNKKTYIPYLMLTFFVNSYGMQPLEPLQDGYTRLGPVQIPIAYKHDVIKGNLYYDKDSKRIYFREPVKLDANSLIPAAALRDLKVRQDFLDTVNKAIYSSK